MRKIHRMKLEEISCGQQLAIFFQLHWNRFLSQIGLTLKLTQKIQVHSLLDSAIW
jgi:hypothetical protein